jgi:SPP1 gp7 family putative phage head morphogenesis protein
MVRSANLSKLLMFKEMGVKEYQWVAHIDERTRDNHRKRHTNVYNVDRAIKGLDPAPGMVHDKSGKWIPSENINCRCRIRPRFRGS